MKILFLILSILISACGEKNNEWKMIFDGQKVDGMRGYKMDSFPWESWEIIDGSLKTIPDAKGVDIISEKVFKDFELELEWKIQKDQIVESFTLPLRKEIIFGNLHLKCRS